MADAMWEREYAALPGVQLIRVDGSRHFIMADQPERFAELVDDVPEVGATAGLARPCGGDLGVSGRRPGPAGELVGVGGGQQGAEGGSAARSTSVGAVRHRGRPDRGRSGRSGRPPCPACVPAASTKGSLGGARAGPQSLPVRVTGCGLRVAARLGSALTAAHRALSSADRSAPLPEQVGGRDLALQRLVPQHRRRTTVLGWAPPVNSKSVRTRLNSLPVSAPGRDGDGLLVGAHAAVAAGLGAVGLGAFGELAQVARPPTA